MEKQKSISGFSKLSKREKIKWLVENFFKDPEAVMRELKSYWLPNDEQQKIFDGFSENTISNYHMPYGVAPNFVIDGKTYCVPMVIEESSVVAAASAAAKFWMDRGGFKTTVLSTEKIGQVHFEWHGTEERLQELAPDIINNIKDAIKPIVANMEARGGGATDFKFRKLQDLNNIYQLVVTFETKDSMGANFINSVLEQSARTMELFFVSSNLVNEDERDMQIIMSILSNFTPNCLVRAEVSCPIEDLGVFPDGMTALDFAHKFHRAIQIAQVDMYRATTHNKGIFNGIDAVVIATGNDFRAIEACGHTYASRKGRYTSLSHCTVDDGMFRFWLEIPLAIGTVGGLTALHPIAKRSLELLESPDGPTLMRIIAATGLAQNFAAIRSLVTTGIQKGHMKMHLLNILNHLGASENQMLSAQEYFSDKVVSYSAVRDYLGSDIKL